MDVYSQWNWVAPPRTNISPFRKREQFVGTDDEYKEYRHERRKLQMQAQERNRSHRNRENRKRPARERAQQERQQAERVQQERQQEIKRVK